MCTVIRSPIAKMKPCWAKTHLGPPTFLKTLGKYQERLMGTLAPISTVLGIPVQHFNPVQHNQQLLHSVFESSKCFNVHYPYKISYIPCR